jgi:hypothetical protein
MLDRTATDIILRKSPDPHTFIFHERKTSVSKPNHNHVRIAGSSEFSMMACTEMRMPASTSSTSRGRFTRKCGGGPKRSKSPTKNVLVVWNDSSRTCSGRTLFQVEAVVCVAYIILIKEPGPGSRFRVGVRDGPLNHMSAP